MLIRCFPVWAQLPSVLALWLNPRLFRRELTLISRLAEVRSESQVRQELESYVYENQRDRLFRTESLGVRLSRRKFVRLMREVRSEGVAEDEAENEAPPPAAGGQ